jgi:branched-chain amino acid aminotransferase
MSVCWLSGAFVEVARARIDPSDRGFTLGDGIFETIRAEAGAPAHAGRHLARLHHGATLLGIEIPFDDQTLHEAMCVVLAQNALASAALRLTLTRGPAARGVLPPTTTQPTILISAGPLPPPAPPARVIVCQRTRRNELSPLAAIKSLNYLDGILARMEATAAGADDALLLNTRGRVAEATAANIFLHVDGNWITPPVQDGALPGIGRALLLERGVATELCVSPETLRRCDAALLVNSLSTRTVAAIDGRNLNLGWAWPQDKGLRNKTADERR